MCFQKGMLVFDVAQFDGILKKITEFNGTILSDQVGNFTCPTFVYFCNCCDKMSNIGPFSPSKLYIWLLFLMDDLLFF